MIRNIVFDMGQVLIHWSGQMFMDRMGVPEEDRTAFARATVQSVEWTQLDRGVLDPAKGAAIMGARLPERLRPCVDKLTLHWWDDPLAPMEGMGALVRELKEKGYGIYLLSNATRALHEYFPRIPGSECFDGLVVSADHGELKPEREIYQTLFREFHLTPAECLFIDDLSINIEGAVFAGMDGIIFRGDAGLLREELRAHGVEVSPG